MERDDMPNREVGLLPILLGVVVLFAQFETRVGSRTRLSRTRRRHRRAQNGPGRTRRFGSTWLSSPGRLPTTDLDPSTAPTHTTWFRARPPDGTDPPRPARSDSRSER